MDTSLSSLVAFFSGTANVIGPVSLASAAVMAASTTAAVIPMLGPGAGSFVYQWFMGVIGVLPKRKKVWGTIYDATTKRPIPFVKVKLLDKNKRVLETRIADKHGRYGFLATTESLMSQNTQVYIELSHDGYVFPSKTAISVDKLVYGNLYYGDLINVRSGELVNFDVPMDPIRPKSANFTKIAPSIVLGASVAAIADASFWLGLAIVPLNFILQPNPFSFGVFCMFLGTASLRIFGISEHPYGVVKDETTGKTVPFALITLHNASGARVAFSVSDELGKYFMVVDKGEYIMDVFTPAPVVPQRHKQTHIKAKKGWITEEIRI